MEDTAATRQADAGRGRRRARGCGLGENRSRNRPEAARGKHQGEGALTLLRKGGLRTLVVRDLKRCSRAG